MGLVLSQLNFLKNGEGLSMGDLNNGCVGLLEEIEDGDETIGESEEQEADRGSRKPLNKYSLHLFCLPYKSTKLELEQIDRTIIWCVFNSFYFF